MTGHPEQPQIKDDVGILRFKKNAIVRYLLDAGPNDLNKLAIIPFSDEDRRQFYQLIGYSVDGFDDVFPRPEPPADTTEDRKER